MYMKENKRQCQTVFIRRYKLVLLLCVSLFSLCNYANASSNDTQLFIKPARCIALHQGQVCYQTLKIIWQTDIADNYCLLQQGNNTPLLCWEHAASGTGNVEFANHTSVKLILVRTRDGQTMTEFMMEVAWVYEANSHRESHWRIF